MKIIDSLISIGKVALRSRFIPSNRSAAPGEILIIMGNGPSLLNTMNEYEKTLSSHDTMAVNFAANTPFFRRVKPRHYVLADPHFFNSEKDPNVDNLWESLSKVDWDMTLHIPTRSKIPELSDNVKIKRFNMTPGEGYDFIMHPIFDTGLAMPRPRNVLIPAIMEGIRAGYKEIYLVGADHSWPHTLYVDDYNRVVTVQPHFYEDNKKELDRVAEEYAGVKLHEVLESMVIAFRSYHEIEKYAGKKGVHVYNATPASLIDAFKRRNLPV